MADRSFKLCMSEIDVRHYELMIGLWADSASQEGSKPRSHRVVERSPSVRSEK